MGKIALAFVASGLFAALLSGCGESWTNPAKKTGSIIGKKTDDIKEFDPNAANQEVSDSKIRADDPILYGLQAYGPIMERISKLNIDYSVRLYEAQEGHYPRSHDEFMKEVIKRYGLKLPVLPAGWKYAYDVENHKLEVVRPKGKDANAPIAPVNAAPAGN